MEFDRSNFIEDTIHVFTAEASELGLPPGRWPRTFTVPGIGNGQAFVLDKSTPEAVHYRQAFGCVSIIIFND